MRVAVAPAEPPPVVSVVVLAFGEEPLLVDCVEALLRSSYVAVDVVVVDNGCTSDAVDRLGHRAGVQVVRPGRNTGFAGGCNLGSERASGQVVALVNSDVLVRPTALAAFVATLEDPSVGIVTGSLRLVDAPEVVNSVGNPVHYLGLSWAGGWGDKATEHDRGRDVASGCGGFMALRRETWDALEGFYEPMFAYGEDVELSLRCRQRGWSVRFSPEAVAAHDYSFGRHPSKMYLLERNRLLTVLTCYEARTLALLAPALLGLELLVLAVAVSQGWGSDKVRAWWWLLLRAPSLARRRAWVQASRVRSDDVVLAGCTGRFAPGPASGLRSPWMATWLSVGYWRLVAPALRRAPAIQRSQRTGTAGRDQSRPTENADSRSCRE